RTTLAGSHVNFGLIKEMHEQLFSISTRGIKVVVRSGEQHHDPAAWPGSRQSALVAEKWQDCHRILRCGGNKLSLDFVMRPGGSACHRRNSDGRIGQSAHKAR